MRMTPAFPLPFREMNVLKNLSNAAQTIIITDADTLREAFKQWQKEEAEKLQKERENTRICAKEAAQRLGVTLSTLWRWEKEKYLVPIKVGKRNTYRLNDILSLEKGGGYAENI